jgi:hypothetical protein
MVGRRRMRRAGFVLVGVLWAGPSLAQGSECTSFGLGLDRLDSGTIVPLGRINDLFPRVNFVKRSVIQKGCPSSRSGCRDKAYLIPGDEVVIIGAKDDFVCASYAGAKGGVTEGWLPRAAVTIVSELPAMGAEEWVGRWISGPEQTIMIASSSQMGRLTIKGEASWGASDPRRVARGAVHVGELDGEAAALGADLSFGMGENGPLPFDEADDVDCKVQMRRLGPYLLVKDNGMCGGMNVTFTGLYRRGS